jgi:transcription elongation factor GreB
VGADETDPAKNRISWLSPVAKALMNRQLGDVATLSTPAGEEELEILRIDYVAIS